ncbi:MAG: flavin reductase family protein, partial [Clostridia bacterium]|nr:flavin reductase family protein [Clostridia bacterium]
MAFRSVPYESLSFNPFTKIGKDWALLTAGSEGDYNTMTVSWGSVGFIWGKPSVTVYVRPQRYTKKFVDRETLFTLSFYSEAHKSALGYLGKASG